MSTCNCNWLSCPANLPISFLLFPFLSSYCNKVDCIPNVTNFCEGLYAFHFLSKAWLGCCFLMGCLCWLTTQKQFLFLPPALLFLSPNILIITVFFFFLNHLVLIHVIFFTLALSNTPATLNLLCSLFDFSHGNKVLCIQLLYIDFFPLVSKCFFS